MRLPLGAGRPGPRAPARVVRSSRLCLAAACALGAWVAVAGCLGSLPARAGSADGPAGTGWQPAQGAFQEEASRLLERLYERGLEQVDPGALERLYGELDPELRRAVRVDLGRFLRTMGREGLPAPGELLQAGAELFWQELRLNARLLARVLALAALGAVLQQLGRDLAARGAQEAAGAAVILALTLLAVQSFTVAARMVLQAVGDMASVAQALMPTLAVLSASAGFAWTAAVLHPLVAAVITLSAELVRRAVVPGLLLGCVLGIAGTIAGEFPMARLASLLQRVSMSVLGLCLTVLLGVVAVRGALAPAADSVTLRTLKFVTSSTVPVVGRMVSEAVEVAAGASVLIRSGLGAAGMLLVVLFAAAPAVKLMAVMLIFSLSAALLEPVGEHRVQRALGILGDTLGWLLACLMVSTVLFLMAVGALVGSVRPGWGL